MDNEIKEIKRRFRLSMNGIVSASMREKGMNYKINFGLTQPLIKEIASSYSPNEELAEKLWEDKAVRESMMLAPHLYPAEKFDKEHAYRWINDIPYTEIADSCCKNLFQNLPFAKELALECIQNKGNMAIYTGYRLIISLMIKTNHFSSTENEVIIAKGLKQCISGNHMTAFISLSCLKRGMKIKNFADKLIPVISEWDKNGNTKQKKIAEDLYLEYEICKEYFPE